MGTTEAPPVETNVARIEVRGNSWVGIARNNEVVVRGEQHTSPSDAERAARDVFPDTSIPIERVLPKRKYDVPEIPKEEPIFTLRAKDKLARRAIAYYQEMYEDEFLSQIEDEEDSENGDKPHVEFNLSLLELVKNFDEFKKENPDKMKLPD